MQMHLKNSFSIRDRSEWKERVWDMIDSVTLEKSVNCVQLCDAVAYGPMLVYVWQWIYSIYALLPQKKTKWSHSTNTFSLWPSPFHSFGGKEKEKNDSFETFSRRNSNWLPSDFLHVQIHEMPFVIHSFEQSKEKSQQKNWITINLEFIIYSFHS